MKRSFKLLLFQLFFTTFLFGQAANHVVISEVSPMKGSSSQFNTGEFVELYNPLSTPVTFGPSAQLISGNTSGTNAAEWQLSLSGVTIQACGFYLVGDGGVTNRDASFPASKNLANSGTRSCVNLRDGAIVVDAFGWDPVTTPTLPAEGTRFTPSSTTSDGKSFERKSGALATTPDNLGNAWDSDNNASDFFQNSSAAANPQNSASPIEIHPYSPPPSGTGAGFISPSYWSHAVGTTMTFTLTATSDTVRGFQLTKPPLFSWDIDTVHVMPSATISVQNDTITITSLALAPSESITVMISGVTAPDTTDEFAFPLLASKDGSIYVMSAGQPKTIVYGTPRPIQQVKRKEPNGVYSLTGRWVLVRGVATTSSDFGIPLYMQDETGGLAVYDTSVASNALRGDEIEVLGLVAPYYDLFELVPAKLIQKFSEGSPFDTVAATAAEIVSQNASEPLEALLLRINGITSVTDLNGSPATNWTIASGTGTNYRVYDGSGSYAEVRVLSRTNLANTAIPSYPFDILGVLSQYKYGSTNYQLLPRSIDDIIVEGAGPRILSAPPYESDITPAAMTIRWQTDVPGTSLVRFGTTTAYGSTRGDTAYVTDHAVTLDSLQPATIYNIQLSCTNAAGTTNSQNYIVSTASLTSSGTVNVYFNKSVNTSLSRGEAAQGNVDFPARLITRINAATYSIDISLYSLSGTVGSTIATALINAKNRGVAVRVIGEKDNQSTVPWTTLKNAGIPVIDDSYDALNLGIGLMHNKFFVFDNRDTTSDADDWVWTGSWNCTDPGTTNDLQNVIEIQDKALANAYTVEFNEMWGSPTMTPNASASRFGARKYDNTPHRFVINGTPVSLYFSPSDRTTSRIISAISGAQYSVGFCLLSFTRSDITNALATKEYAGLRVHGVMDNNTDQGTQFDTLNALGIDTRLDVNGAYLHHKYCIVDAEGPGANAVTVTGSHNWSSNAENSNNENTLIVHSDRIANLYLQEFAARYQESGGTDLIAVGVEEEEGAIPTQTMLEQNYPNPFNPLTNVDFRLTIGGPVKVNVVDLLGREVSVLVDQVMSPGTYRFTWDASAFPSGVYFYRLKAGSFTETKRMVLLK